MKKATKAHKAPNAMAMKARNAPSAMKARNNDAVDSRDAGPTTMLRAPCVPNHSGGGVVNDGVGRRCNVCRRNPSRQKNNCMGLDRGWRRKQIAKARKKDLERKAAEKEEEKKAAEEGDAGNSASSCVISNDDSASFSAPVPENSEPAEGEPYRGMARF